MPRLSDFRQQSRNANRHTYKGLQMLEESIASNGFIGAITVVADGEAIDGSARLDTVTQQMGDVEPIVIRSKGDRPIIHIREDIPNADDPKAKKLAIAANRIAQVDLNFDAEILKELSQEIDISDLFSEEELDRLSQEFEANIEPDAPEWEDEEEGGVVKTGSGIPDDRYPLAIVLSSAEFQQWRQLKDAIRIRNDKQALLKLVEMSSDVG